MLKKLDLTTPYQNISAKGYNSSMKTKLVLFGITGDLSRRKLLPALEAILQTGEYEDLSIIGVSRRQVSVEELLPGDDELARRTTIFSMDLAELDEYNRLKEHLNLQADEQALMYLSVPPGSATRIADFIGEVGLNGPNIKILFEKPFGLDLVSAGEMIERTSQYFEESQIYRIDHYMAKEIAREIIRLRQDADNHHHHWSAQTIERVEIVAHEQIGVEGRGEFYEQTGALRDVIQGHLMQLLALVLMQPPKELSELPEARLEALNKLTPLHSDNLETSQYDGYKQEVGNDSSTTETYAKVTLHSSDPAWEGVPLVLETGKKMPEKRTYIRVVYRDGTEDLFDESNIVYEDDSRLKDAYEHVLLDAISGRREIFTTSEEVLASWGVLKVVS